MADYESDTAFLGQKGPFFWTVFFLLNSIYISTGFTGFYIVFAGAVPPHRCHVPEVNLTDAWMEAAIPTQEVHGEVQKSTCSRYKLDVIRAYSDMGFVPGQDVNVTDIEQEPCLNGWVYSKDIYQSTIVTEWDLVCEDKWKVPFASSTLYMGYLLGSLISGQLSDRFGRKKVVFICLAGHFLCILIQSFSPTWVVFCILYFFVGAFQISLYVTSFVLGTEVLSKSMRVLFTTLGSFLHYCIGYMLLPLIAYFMRDWRPLLQILATMTVVYFPLWWYIPESPRWLVSQGRVEEAEAIVRDAAKRNRVTTPEVIFKSLEVDVASSNTRRYTMLDVLRTGNVRCITLLCLVLWMAVNIGYFGLSLNTSNLIGNPYLNCFLSAATEVPAYFVSTVLLKNCPRRHLLSTFLIAGGGFLLLIQLIPPSLYGLSLALEMVGKFGFTMLFTVVYMYTAEIYPTVMRNVGIGMCSSAARIGSITAPYIIYLGTFSKYLPYILMGSLTVGSSFVNLLLPETFGKQLPETLEEMQKCRVMRPLRRQKGCCLELGMRDKSVISTVTALSGVPNLASTAPAGSTE
uniref:Major facilitator superfamily (MFS) profile domain-containing protein n=1 Tax=Denticeps clupeoides TaxID=299321 RepID=A0AAY4CDH5_9TELE